MKMRVIVVEGAEMSAASRPKEDYTLDGSVDIKGRPAVKGTSGGWIAGGLILGTAMLSIPSHLPLFSLGPVWKSRFKLKTSIKFTPGKLYSLGRKKCAWMTGLLKTNLPLVWDIRASSLKAPRKLVHKNLFFGSLRKYRINFSLPSVVLLKCTLQYFLLGHASIWIHNNVGSLKKVRLGYQISHISRYK
jgi:hypothetical protein